MLGLHVTLYFILLINYTPIDFSQTEPVFTVPSACELGHKSTASTMIFIFISSLRLVFQDAQHLNSYHTHCQFFVDITSAFKI